MSAILYYSNYCNSCKKMLMYFSKSQIKKDIHFIPIDSRVEDNGKMYMGPEWAQNLSSDSFFVVKRNN